MEGTLIGWCSRLADLGFRGSSLPRNPSEEFPAINPMVVVRHFGALDIPQVICGSAEPEFLALLHGSGLECCLLGLHMRCVVHRLFPFDENGVVQMRYCHVPGSPEMTAPLSRLPLRCHIRGYCRSQGRRKQRRLCLFLLSYQTSN